MAFEVDPKDGMSPEARPSPGESRSGGERSEPERSGSPDVSRPNQNPDPEVPEKATRRRFSAQYKLRILKEADAGKGKPGALGELIARCDLAVGAC